MAVARSSSGGVARTFHFMDDVICIYWPETADAQMHILHCVPENVHLNNTVENDFFGISQGKVATSDR